MNLCRTLSIEGGNFGVILNYKERPIGYYPVTIATLELFLQLLRGIGYLQEREEQPVNFLNLAACEIFILREVFSSFHKWRFTRMEYKEKIGEYMQRKTLLHRYLTQYIRHV